MFIDDLSVPDALATREYLLKEIEKIEDKLESEEGQDRKEDIWLLEEDLLTLRFEYILIEDMLSNVAHDDNIGQLDYYDI